MLAKLTKVRQSAKDNACAVKQTDSLKREFMTAQLHATINSTADKLKMSQTATKTTARSNKLQLDTDARSYESLNLETR